jgi:hypothetical protein
MENVRLEDKSQAFNTARIECLELQNLFEVAEATAVVAEASAMRVAVPTRARISPSVTMRTGCATRFTTVTASASPSAA